MDDLDHRTRLLAASLAPEVPHLSAVHALLKDPDAWAEPEGLDARQLAKWRALTAGPLQQRLAAELEALRAIGGWFLTPLDPQWPADLPPDGVLRGLGRLPAGPMLAIVGARQADPYGLELAGRVARAAVERGVPVVSGGAFGVDIAAHRAALAAGGETVVVLGAGLDKASPSAHRAVFRQAALQGAVVSPFPMGLGAARWSFPQRNPWIAGLAAGCVVVQAAQRSGSLQTARAAMRLGRPVFAIAGSMDNPLHAGCHALVGEGAQLLTAADAWAPQVAPDARRPAPTDAGLEGPPHGQALWAVTTDEPTDLARLADAAGLPVPEASALATTLELSGWLRRAPGGRYARSRPR